MGTINVNGRTITVPDGCLLSIINGIVLVDGKPWDGEKLTGIVKIDVTGTLLNLSSDQSVEVHGDVQGDLNAKGSVSCNNVGGSVDSGGSCSCDDVQGNVKAGGSVNCDDVGGSVNAGGSVRHG